MLIFWFYVNIVTFSYHYNKKFLMVPFKPILERKVKNRIERDSKTLILIGLHRNKLMHFKKHKNFQEIL